MPENDPTANRFRLDPIELKMGRQLCNVDSTKVFYLTSNENFFDTYLARVVCFKYRVCASEVFALGFVGAAAHQKE